MDDKGNSEMIIPSGMSWKEFHEIIEENHKRERALVEQIIEQESNKMKGTIVRINEVKAFGFIHAKGEQSDYFFHKDDFIGHWQDLVKDFKSYNKIRVEFESRENPKGPRAANVSRLDFPNQSV